MRPKHVPWQGFTRSPPAFSALLWIFLSILPLVAAISPAKTAEMPPFQTAEDLIGRIRAAMAAVDKGVKTGKFESLRALGTPEFAANHDDDALQSAFRPLVRTGTDLSQLQQATPVTPGPPRVDANGTLRLNGLFQLAETNIGFDLVYVWQNARYALSAVAVMPRAKAEQPMPFGTGPASPSSGQ